MLNSLKNPLFPFASKKEYVRNNKKLIIIKFVYICEAEPLFEVSGVPGFEKYL